MAANLIRYLCLIFLNMERMIQRNEVFNKETAKKRQIIRIMMSFYAAVEHHSHIVDSGDLQKAVS